MTVVGEAFIRVMPDTTRFKAQLDAQLRTAGVAAAVKVPIQINTQGAAASLSRSLGGAVGPARQAGSAVGHAFNQEVVKSVSASSEAMRKLLADFRNLLVLSTGISIIARPFAELVGAGVKAAANLEQTQIAFSGLLGSSEEATDAIAQFRDFAAKTPFEFPGVVQAAQRFIGLGKTVEETLNILGTIGDATAAIGAPQEAIARVTLAFSQIQASGRLLAQDLNQITQALPNITRGAVFEQLAEDMGKSTEEIRALQEQGAIPAEQALQSLLKVMKQIPGAEGAMERQSKTLIGVFSTFKDEVRFALSDAFEPLIPALSNSLKNAEGPVSAALRDFGIVLAEGLTQALPILTEVLTGLAPVLISLTQATLAVLPAFSGLTTILVAIEPALTAFASIIDAIPGPLLELVGVLFAVKLAFTGMDRLAGSSFRTISTGVQDLARSRGLSTFQTSLRVTQSSLQGFGQSMGALLTPTNLAIAGIGILITALASAKRAAAEHKREVDALTRAYLDNADAAAIDAQKTLEAAIQAAGQDDELRAAGLSLREFTKLQREGTAGFNEFIDRLEQTGLISSNFADAMREGIADGKNFNQVLLDLAGSGKSITEDGSKLVEVFIQQRDVQQEAASAAINLAIANDTITAAQARAAEAANLAQDGTTDYLGALEDLGLELPDVAEGATGLAGDLENVGSAAAQAAGQFEALDKALSDAKALFDQTVGAAFNLADAEAELESTNDHLAELQEKLKEELSGTTKELEDVADAADAVEDAERGLADAHERVIETTEKAAESQELLNDLRATESTRVARQLADAERDLERTKLRLIELEQDLADKIAERAAAEDPAKLAELTKLRTLRANVGAAPPSFLEDLDDRIAKLAEEAGPEAVASLDREIAGLQLDIADGQLAVEDALAGLTDAQRQAIEGTQELRDAEKEAAAASRELLEAHEGVEDATRKVIEQQQALQEAYGKLQPDQAKVRDLQREIESAQRDSITAAFDLASAIVKTSGESADAITNTLGAAFTGILEQFPQIKAAFENLAPTIQLQLGANVTVENVEELVQVFTDIFAESQEQLRGQGRFAQHGGVFGRGEAVTVGEGGPELFVPEQAGRILSNRDSIASIAEGIRQAIIDALGELPVAAGAAPNISVVAPSTDARDVVDGVMRGLRAQQFLAGVT